MMDIGVASPSAHGQAMISTATALTSACARRGSGPNGPHATKLTSGHDDDRGHEVAGTRRRRAAESARELRCASPTMRDDLGEERVGVPRARRASRILPVAVDRRRPSRLSPGRFSIATGSPVTIDSSTALDPSMTDAIDGDPLSRAHAQPVADHDLLERDVRIPCRHPVRTRAVLGVKPRSARIAPFVLLRARSSSTCPRSTRTVMTLAASK